MVTVPFGEYLPDLPSVNNPGLTVVNNALPEGVGYKQLRSPEIVSDALTARCRYFTSVADDANVNFTYAGDATKLYILAVKTWSGAGTYTLTESDLWESVIWDKKIIFSNINDEPVSATLGSGTFSTFFTSTEKPKAHHMAVIADTLVMGDINSTATGIERNGVIWSALGNYLDMDPATATNAGAQKLRGNGGEINKIIGGRVGYIFQRNAIWRMSFAGPPILFRFDQVSDNIGCIAKAGCIEGADGRDVFFLADEGFHLMNKVTGQTKSIGHNRVDDTVLSEIDLTNLHRCSTAVGPLGLFYFSYSTTGGDPDRLLIYNPHEDRWGRGSFTHEIVGLYRGGAQTIDAGALASRDIDADPYLIDSAEFKGGVPSLAIFDGANRLASMEGVGLTATFETGEAAFQQGRRNYVNRARPIVTGSTASSTVTLGTRELLTEDAVFGSAVAVNAEGEASIRGSGRYMRFRTTISGGFDQAIAIEVEPKQKGRK